MPRKGDDSTHVLELRERLRPITAALKLAALFPRLVVHGDEQLDIDTSNLGLPDNLGELQAEGGDVDGACHLAMPSPYVRS